MGDSPWGHKKSDMTLTEHTHTIGGSACKTLSLLVYELKRKS